MSYEHKLMIMVARKASGKSTYLNNLAEDYVKANNQKKALIIDVNFSPAYDKHINLSPRNFEKWCNDINFWRYRRVKRFYMQEHKEMFKLMADNYRNGLIVFEDCTKYIRSNIDLEMLKFITDHRMMQCDLVFTFHSIQRVPKQFWEMATHVIIGKTQESFDLLSDREIQRRYPNGMEIKKTWLEVMASEDNYIKKVVRTLI